MPADWRNLTLDVLKQIYSLCEDRDLPKCAQTCKNWTSLALDRVWYELRPMDFIHLFAILAPLRPSQDQTDDALIRMVRSQIKSTVEQRLSTRISCRSSRGEYIKGTGNDFCSIRRGSGASTITSSLVISR